MVGFDLYCQMVEESVKEIKGEKILAKIEPEIDLQIKGYIPKDYISDLNQRLDIYRRLQLLSDTSGISLMTSEMQDRYGPLPEPVAKLLAILEIKLYCQKLHISRAKIIAGEVLCCIDRRETATRKRRTPNTQP